MMPGSARAEDGRMLFSGPLWTKRKDQIWYQQSYAINTYGILTRLSADGKGKACHSGAASGASTARSGSPITANVGGGLANMFSKIAQLPNSTPKSYDRIDLGECRSIEADMVDGNFLDIGDRQQLPGFVVQDKDGTSYRFVARTRQEQATWLSTVQAFLNQHSHSPTVDAKRKSPNARSPEFDAGQTRTVHGVLEEELTLGESRNWLVASGYTEDVLAELTSLRAQVRDLEEDKQSLQLALSVALERMSSWTTSLFSPLSQPPLSQPPLSQPPLFQQHEQAATEGSDAGSGEEESGDRFESEPRSPSRILSHDSDRRSSLLSPEPGASSLLSPHLNISPLNSSRELRPPSPCGSFRSTSTHSHGSRCKYA